MVFVSYLARIIVYPIKSLDGVAVDRATVLPSGALQYDREYAIADQQGKFINGKRSPKVHLLRSQFDLATKTVSLKVAGTASVDTFHLDGDRAQLEGWLSDYFSTPVRLQQNSLAGFPDDTNASGPTIISTATLKAVAAWFPGGGYEEMSARWRTNLEIADVRPFWEDQLFAHEGDLVEFQIGEVHFLGINPCQRCIVPTRHPLTGEVYPHFQKIFVVQRQATLPPGTVEVILMNIEQLVTDYDIKGKRTHDIRLLAVMKSHNITHLLTFNSKDFIQLPKLTIVHPQDIMITKTN